MSYVDDLIARMVAVEDEAFTAGGITMSVFPYPHIHNVAPYMSNWLSGFEPKRQSPNEDLITLEFTIELIVGLVTAGLPGEKLALINVYTPIMHRAFRSNPNLVSSAYPTKLANLRDTTLVSGRGLVQLEAVEGVPARWATYFIVTAQYLEKVTQAHY